MDTEQKIARGVVAILVKAIATAEGKAAVARAWGRDAGAAERAAVALRAELARVEAQAAGVSLPRRETEDPAEGRACEAATKTNDSAQVAAGGPVSSGTCETAAPSPPQAPPAPVEGQRAPLSFPSEMTAATGTAIHLLSWEGRLLPLDRPPSASGAGPPE